MDAARSPATTDTTNRSVGRPLLATIIGVAAVTTSALLVTHRSGPALDSGYDDPSTVDAAAAVGPGDAWRVVPSRRFVATSSDGDRAATAQAAPDATADDTGGIAARLHAADGMPIPGNVFLLMAAAGSEATARLYDDTPYTHDNGTTIETHASNVAAVDTVETVTGIDVDLLELTTASGGGASGGIAYTIAYLNVVSGGAFSGDLRIAATGRIGSRGYVDPISAIDEKTTAAHLADADVLFTPSTPGDDHLDTYGARYVGERFRAKHTGSPLEDERRLDNYRTWGSNRPDGMDIVHVRHVADVAAYLCGAGSSNACDVTELLADTTTELASEPVETETSPLRIPAGAR